MGVFSYIWYSIIGGCGGGGLEAAPSTPLCIYVFFFCILKRRRIYDKPGNSDCHASSYIPSIIVIQYLR